MTEPAAAAAPRIERALISVSDKTGLVDFARALAARGVEILSTGGTARALKDAGIAVKDVSEHTGFPEMMDGRLKTLHPVVHGGLLAVRGNAEHARAAAQHAIAPIDLLVVNLYPFEATVAKGAAYAECVENIDIGGPAMIRAAAKNHAAVTVVVDAEDYAEVLAEMAQHGGATSLALRQALAAKAYARTAAYDAAIGNWFAETLGERAPRRRAFAGRLAQELRYGENPHQRAAFYLSGERRPGVATATQHQGKELSYNNLGDADAAIELVAEFDPAASAAVAIIKHANPCGVAARRHAARGLCQGLPLRSRQPVRRHHRAQSADRCGDGRRGHQDPDRDRHRPRCERRGQGDLRPQEEPAPADHRRPAGPARAGAHIPLARGRLPGAVARQRRGRRPRAEGGDQAAADAAGAGRSEVRLQGRQARQVERHRLRQGRRHRRHRRRPDEPRRQLAHRGVEIAGGDEGRRPDASRWPRARWWPPTRSSRSPTACWRPPRPAPRR